MGWPTSLGSTDVYTYAELGTSIFVGPVVVATLYGMIMTSYDLYETVNASGSEGACSTCDESST